MGEKQTDGQYSDLINVPYREEIRLKKQVPASQKTRRISITNTSRFVFKEMTFKLKITGNRRR